MRYTYYLMSFAHELSKFDNIEYTYVQEHVTLKCVRVCIDGWTQSTFCAAVILGRIMVYSVNNKFLV
jgi:hypothetical protein